MRIPLPATRAQTNALHRLLQLATMVSGASVFGVSAHAQVEKSGPRDVADFDILELLKPPAVTLAAKRKQSVLQAAAAVTVIDAKDIDMVVGHGIADIMRRVGPRGVRRAGGGEFTGSNEFCGYGKNSVISTRYKLPPGRLSRRCSPRIQPRWAHDPLPDPTRCETNGKYERMHGGYC